MNSVATTYAPVLLTNIAILWVPIVIRSRFLKSMWYKVYKLIFAHIQLEIEIIIYNLLLSKYMPHTVFQMCSADPLRM